QIATRECIVPQRGGCPWRPRERGGGVTQGELGTMLRQCERSRITVARRAGVLARERLRRGGELPAQRVRCEQRRPVATTLERGEHREGNIVVRLGRAARDRVRSI